MSFTVSTKTYSSNRVLPDSVAYAGPANTLSVKDTIELKRVFPKPTATFPGVARPAIKFVRGVTLPDGSVHDAILTISGSLPVGMTDAAIDALVDDAVSILQLEAADTSSVFKKLKLSY